MPYDAVSYYQPCNQLHREHRTNRVAPAEMRRFGKSSAGRKSCLDF